MCKHEQFQSWVKITRLTETEASDVITGYTSDIKIHCAQCGMPFEFIGVPGGVNPAFPTVSADNTELRAPIRPSKQPIEKIPGKVYN